MRRYQRWSRPRGAARDIVEELTEAEVKLDVGG